MEACEHRDCDDRKSRSLTQWLCKNTQSLSNLSFDQLRTSKICSEFSPERTLATSEFGIVLIQEWRPAGFPGAPLRRLDVAFAHKDHLQHGETKEKAHPWPKGREGGTKKEVHVCIHQRETGAS